MGIYLNPSDIGSSFKEKVEWCQSVGTLVTVDNAPADEDFLLTHESTLTNDWTVPIGILVIVLDNGPFAAMGVMHNIAEVEAAIGSGSRIWMAFYIPKDVVLDNMGDDRIYVNIVNQIGVKE